MGISRYLRYHQQDKRLMLRQWKRQVARVAELRCVPSTDIKKKGVILRVIPNRVRLWCLFAYPCAAQHPVLSSKKKKNDHVLFYTNPRKFNSRILIKMHEIWPLYQDLY